MSVDVEEWFNILDIPGEIPFEKWGEQENRLGRNLEKILEILRKYNVKATCFWLGYFAEKYPELVRTCAAEGHEIASHGYAHIMAYKALRKDFREDITRAKGILENIIQKPVLGFRAAGFSTIGTSSWVMDEIRGAGYVYDSSIFPGNRTTGGSASSTLGIHTLHTRAGDLLEIPQSMVSMFGQRFCMFGGGYLRLFPYPLIKLGIRQLDKRNLPLVVYVHPREMDPDHPRLRMSMLRRFKSYVNLKTVPSKLTHLFTEYHFLPMNAILNQENAADN